MNKALEIQCKGHKAPAIAQRNPFDPDYKEIVVQPHNDGEGECPETGRVF